MNPESNALVVPFLGLCLRALRGEATGTQETADMVRVVEDPKTVPDQLDDSSASPQSGRKSAGFRPLENPSHQTAKLPGAQLRGPTGGGPGPQAGASLQAIGPLPPPDRSSIHPQTLRHHMRLDALPEKPQGAATAAFQFCRAAVWSHPTPLHTA